MEARFDLRTDAATPILAISGDWTVEHLGGVERGLRDLPQRPQTLDVHGLGRIDVAGAYVLTHALGGKAPPRIEGAHESVERLFGIVAERTETGPQTPHRQLGVIDLLERVGRSADSLRREAASTLEFLGRSLVALARLLLHPRQIRWVSVVHVMEVAGLNALPIIVTLNFFVGLVVAYLGARSLGDFGASVFTVELVAVSVMREFAVVITAVLLAGRTDSAFTAEIGAMKMRQEIDAMRVMGLDPLETLVVPRLIAMLVMTPLLAFAAVIAGLAGGLVACWTYLHVSPAMFIARVHENVPWQHFFVGMSKAPVFAAVLAVVGCRNGLAVGGDVSSLGKHVTAAVVEAIFLIILLDAVFALWFLELDL